MFGLGVRTTEKIFCDKPGLARNEIVLKSTLTRNHDLIKYHAALNDVAEGI